MHTVLVLGHIISTDTRRMLQDLPGKDILNEILFLLLLFFQELDGCNYFTHYESSSLCYTLAECVSFSMETCTDCISGDSTCGGCGSGGVCNGTELAITDDKSETACSYRCSVTEDCQWYSFDGMSASCTLTSDCQKVVDCNMCVHGEKSCGNTNEGETPIT